MKGQEHWSFGQSFAEKLQGINEKGKSNGNVVPTSDMSDDSFSAPVWMNTVLPSVFWAVHVRRVTHSGFTRNERADVGFVGLNCQSSQCLTHVAVLGDVLRDLVIE